MSRRYSGAALPVRRMRTRPSPSMRGVGQANGGGAPAGGVTHAVHYGVDAQWQRKRRAHRGRPRKGEEGESERVYRLSVHTKALRLSVATFGWLVLATTVSEHTCDDAEIVRAYREQSTTVEPGFRWIKNPAAISPVWLEKRERIAA
jgi:hypothetical protein